MKAVGLGAQPVDTMGRQGIGFWPVACALFKAMWPIKDNPRPSSIGTTVSARARYAVSYLKLAQALIGRLVKRLAVICIVKCYLVSGFAFASGLETVIPNCPHWLAAADDFLDDCKVHARDFRTTFYPSGDGGRGEQEQHRVWFASASADHHFLMGCTLGPGSSLRFLGIYYTAEPSVIAQANTAPIVGVGFDGDVALAVDSHTVTFVAVQPFDTRKVKTRWSNSTETSKNCQSPMGRDGVTRPMKPIYADFSRFDSEGIIEEGEFPDTKKVSKYLEFFPSSLPPEVIYSWHGVVIVTTSGSVFVKKDWFPRACSKGDPLRVANSPLLLHQLCRLRTHDQTLTDQAK
jgi:hypothetical protein